MQEGIFNCLFIFVIAALNDYVIVASIIAIAIRNSINCAALMCVDQLWIKVKIKSEFMNDAFTNLSIF